MTKDEALKLALEALEEYVNVVVSVNDPNEWTPKVADAGEPARKAITAIKEALAQPEQEPVAWISHKELLVMRGNAYAGAKDWRVNLGLEPQEGDVGLYTTPPQCTWVGLTDKEIDELWMSHHDDFGNALSAIDYERAIEAKLKEKNT
jgi:hypothetical protein